MSSLSSHEKGTKIAGLLMFVPFMVNGDKRYHKKYQSQLKKHQHKKTYTRCYAIVQKSTCINISIYGLIKHKYFTKSLKVKLKQYR